MSSLKKEEEHPITNMKSNGTETPKRPLVESLCVFDFFVDLPHPAASSKNERARIIEPPGECHPGVAELFDPAKLSRIAMFAFPDYNPESDKGMFWTIDNCRDDKNEFSHLSHLQPQTYVLTPSTTRRRKEEAARRNFEYSRPRYLRDECFPPHIFIVTG